MALYEILVNRPCILILKELYESEVVNKKVYTIRASDIKRTLNLDPYRHIDILEKNGLLHVDVVKDDKVISLNQKGKDFFKLFDKLKVLTESQVKVIEDRPIATIRYELSEGERKALISLYMLNQQMGSMPIHSLIIEDNNQYAVYDKLQKLNLIARVKNPKGRGMTISLTPAGEKAIKQDFSEKLK